MVYNFKDIMVVPTAKDFVDATLSKTQRKTPTEIHRQYDISRIRKFYMRKVKFTCQSFRDRLDIIINQFPKVEDMHPFYSDLFNTLYNTNHYKLALGQLNTAKHLVERISSDYVRLLKYADSLYRAKQLKIAALGRMVTIMKKQSRNLGFLEEVRQHMSRLPTIDPNGRTLLLCGCPNAGKSSFINLITNAKVEVQPYAFTTKSLYVGHTDYEYLQWQVIDTPGILDRPIEDMNTVELTSITALAHLKSAVIFFLDISEMCEMTIEQQLKIFEGIKPLFADKPLIIACNKSDIRTLAQLEESYPEKRALLKTLEDEGVTLIETSAVSKDGVMDIKRLACDKLLLKRVNGKLENRKVESILNRLHVAMPKYTKPLPAVPKVTKRKRVEPEAPTEKLEKELEQELQEDYILDLNKTKLLANPEEKYDKIPLYRNGAYIPDYITPDLVEKSEALFRQEKKREENGVYDIEAAFEPLSLQEKLLLETGRAIRKIIKVKNMNRKACGSTSGNKPTIARKDLARRERTTTSIREEFEQLGFDMSETKNANFAKTDRSRSVKRRKVESDAPVAKKIPRDQSGLRDAEMVMSAKKKIAKAKIATTKKGRLGEADRKIVDLKPKHLYAGKRGIGKTDRR